MDIRRDGDPLAVLEALLFVSEAPLSFERIEQVLEDRSAAEITSLLDQLRQRLQGEDRGLALVEVAGGYRLMTKPEMAPWIQRFQMAKPARLSKAALETLAIIAYKQPITKPEVEAIRGVMVDGVMKTLMDRDLVRVLGRKPEVGRPILYGTSRDFLEYFGLKDLSELPSLKEIESLALNAPEDEVSREGVDEGTQPL